MCDHSTEKAAEIGRVKRSWVLDGACKADWFERLVGVSELDKGVNAGGVEGGKAVVESVLAAVKAGAGIEEGGKWDDGGGVGFAEGESDGG